MKKHFKRNFTGSQGCGIISVVNAKWSLGMIPGSLIVAGKLDFTCYPRNFCLMIASVSTVFFSSTDRVKPSRGNKILQGFVRPLRAHIPLTVFSVHHISLCYRHCISPGFNNLSVCITAVLKHKNTPSSKINQLLRDG